MKNNYIFFLVFLLLNLTLVSQNKKDATFDYEKYIDAKIEERNAVVQEYSILIDKLVKEFERELIKLSKSNYSKKKAELRIKYNQRIHKLKEEREKKIEALTKEINEL